MTLLYYFRYTVPSLLARNIKPSLLNSYGGAAAAFVFITLSLGKQKSSPVEESFTNRITASGLLWLSEVIEEHSRSAKVIGQRGIYVSVLCVVSYHIILNVIFI